MNNLQIVYGIMVLASYMEAEGKSIKFSNNGCLVAIPKDMVEEEHLQVLAELGWKYDDRARGWVAKS